MGEYSSASKAKKIDQTNRVTKKRSPAKKENPPWLWPVMGGATLLLVGAVVAGILLTRPKKEEPVKKEEVVEVAKKPEPKPAPKTKEEPPAPQPKEKTAEPPPKEATPIAKAPEPKPPEPKFQKHPVPDEAAQALAEKKIKEAYKADYAKEKPDDKLALAAKFLQPGRENRADIPEWFVLLREARDLSVAAERPRLAVEAINEIDRWFLIAPHEMKILVLTKINQTKTAPALRDVIPVALSQIRWALDDDQHDAALKLVAIAEDAAKKAVEEEKDGSRKKEQELEFAQKIEPRKKMLQDLDMDFKAVALANGKIKQAPDDPEANGVLGKHLCIFHGKWDEGLIMLAKGIDNDLKVIAKKDLANPEKVKAQIDVGDEWWSLANTAEGTNQEHLRQRALHWYDRAEPMAKDSDKTKLTGRIKEAKKEAEKRAAERYPRLMLGSFYGRSVEDKILLLRAAGGTMRSEEAVERGLQWLAEHQAKSGAWGNDTFAAAVPCACGDPGEKHDIAGTAFGILPFLGAGETHKNGKYTATVSRGINYLVKKQKPEGQFSDNGYEHALATTALCEAYGLTKDPSLKARCHLALAYIVKGQNRDGSWGYAPNPNLNAQKGDLSNTGWQFTALKTGYYAKLGVPSNSFKVVGGFLNYVADPNQLGYGYDKPAEGRATTATGLLCREYLGWGPQRKEMRKMIEHFMRGDNLPTQERPSLYFTYYATQVMHHWGGKDWETWNNRVRDLLIELQDKGQGPGPVHQKGSWSPSGDDFAKQGGRLAFTSLALMTLEAYYYHVPLYADELTIWQE